MLAWWARSEEPGTTRTMYVRESGRSTGEHWGHNRMGGARDATTKAVCAKCNNGWMNDLDNELRTLGSQLIKGRTVRLTKGKQASLARWAMKTILMLQLTHPRQGRFVIPPEDYRQFGTTRQPDDGTLMWTGHMEPPGKRGGPTLAFVEYRCDEVHWDESLVSRVGLDNALACTGYSASLRVGYCLTAVLKTGSPILAAKSVSTNPRHWTAIWPAFGTRVWPPLTHQPMVGLPPFRVGLRPPK